ncbi:hypothetical protein AB5J62_22860 [Amycolatopsis sp. cg5]|uniref:hypothetical protein n=1 Tax=Amycolatopsis sp. cg5 TaxID=3238802 RepID=UPI0035247FF2
MTIFACVGCEAALTAPMAEVALPAHAHAKWGNGVAMPVLMAAGTYAVDPEPTGWPWRRWTEISEAEAAAQGVFAPVWSVSFAPAGSIVTAPGDAVGTALIPGRHSGFCCGLDGGDGPNLACAQCGKPVATRIDDCSFWQAVWFEPEAVRAVPGAVPAPIATRFSNRFGELEAAGGLVLARLVAISEGMPITVPDGPVADLLRRALDKVLPAGAKTKTAALAGPGLPERDADIYLVPGEHPAGARTVAVPDEVWSHLAFPSRWPPIPATGGFPDGVLRDDPPPRPPRGFSEPDRGVFLHALARMPAVREPWLREIYDLVRADWHALR